MKKAVLIYLFTVIFFLRGLWSWLTSGIKIAKKVQPAQPSSEINLLDEGEINLTPKPSQAQAMANQAKFGFGQMPKEHKGKIVAGGIALAFFVLFGIGNFIYWSGVIISAYPLVGYLLLSVLIGYILLRIIKSIPKHVTTINQIWKDAKHEATLKFQNQ